MSKPREEYTFETEGELNLEAFLRQFVKAAGNMYGLQAEVVAIKHVPDQGHVRFVPV